MTLRKENRMAEINVRQNARQHLLSGLPVAQRCLELAGISTAVLEGGEGPPVVLLHGPGEYAAKWRRVIPDLVKTHRVIAPDLPGHGSSEVGGGLLDTDRVLAWLGELLERTCAKPPMLVGQILGGAIAARFAAARGALLSRLVLADSLGLAPFQPAPEFARALMAFLARPTEETHDGLWRRCAFDLDALRAGMGESWTWLKAYNLDRACAPGLGAVQRGLMEQFGMPAIAPTELAQITVPTTLIWGRHDLATPLSVAEAASARYAWPLHVIEAAADDPALEQPAAFLRALG
jgi:pimeloyl-ACP methyl ester carboxylesterase